jgi:hypothetical protein
MSKRLLRAAALLVTGVLAARVQAKPPDLPVNVYDTFTPDEQQTQLDAQIPPTYEVPPEDPLVPLPLGEPRDVDGGFYIVGEFLYLWQTGPTVTGPTLWELCRTIWAPISSALYEFGPNPYRIARSSGDAFVAQIPPAYEVPPEDPIVPLPVGGPRYEEGGLYFSSEDVQWPLQSNPTKQGSPGLCQMCRTIWEAISSVLCGSAGSQDAPVCKPCPEDAGPEHLGKRHADTARGVDRVLAARRIYNIGERCLQKGDLDTAYSCFQEVHLLAPSSQYGLRAIYRMGEIEARRSLGGAEQAEPPATPPPAATPEQDLSDADHLDSARRLFQVGERCQRDGDLDMARNCYDEARLICPGSRCGRLAARRIVQIDGLRSAEESCEPPEEQAPPRDESWHNPDADSPVPLSPYLRPIDDRLVEVLDNLLRQSNADRPTLNVLETHPSPAAGFSLHLTRPLLVPAAPSRLTIEEHPQPADTRPAGE